MLTPVSGLHLSFKLAYEMRLRTCQVLLTKYTIQCSIFSGLSQSQGVATLKIIRKNCYLNTYLYQAAPAEQPGLITDRDGPQLNGAGPVNAAGYVK